MTSLLRKSIEDKQMEQKSLFDGIHDGKPISNQPIATVVLPRSHVSDFNLPIVEGLPPKKIEKLLSNSI